MRELSLHLLDLMENAVEAGATRLDVTIEESLSADSLTLEVRDDGRGMPPELARSAMDPFVTTRKTRHLGMGLALTNQAALQCDGRLELTSQVGQGTLVRATFRHGHIDRAPLGDVVGALLAILLSQRPVDLVYRHRVGDRCFALDTREVRQLLGPVPLTHPLAREWLVATLSEGEAELRLGMDDLSGSSTTHRDPRSKEAEDAPRGARAEEITPC